MPPLKLHKTENHLLNMKTAFNDIFFSTLLMDDLYATLPSAMRVLQTTESDIITR